MSQDNYDYLICLDFEATCWDNSKEHEIIEFPSVVIDIKKREIVDRIEQFVKPSKNHILSDFCKKLTSIKQEEVDGGISLKEALDNHYKFVQKYPNSILVTGGDWDLRTMLPGDCLLNKLVLPNYYKKWINAKVPFKKLYGEGKWTMDSMLKRLDMKFIGTPHRGIADCSMLALICIRILEDDWIPEMTGQLK